MNSKYSFPKDKINILLLEAINQTAVNEFEKAGYKVQLKSAAMSESELKEAIKGAHILGIRSKTNVSPEVLDNADSLLSIGCFCIGTNQVALKDAEIKGVPVFNAPYSNTRSVAEMVMAEVVMLSRRLAYQSKVMHEGKWDKSAKGCNEVRNKTIGIIGYGNIGPQVGLLAEAFGMNVLFYDILQKLPLGTATQVATMEELLSRSDFVTLHVPETDLTKNMVAKEQISQMKDGAYLINLSRGTVVVIEDLVDALNSGKISGAAVDVFPVEPKSKDEEFLSELRGHDNVILTPHIGGSTEEAQENIGVEVAQSLVKFLETGSTTGSVNFPNVDLPVVEGAHRVLNIHQNVPGTLGKINNIISSTGANISAQYLSTSEKVGYMIIDVDKSLSRDIKKEIAKLDENIKTRLLF